MSDYEQGLTIQEHIKLMHKMELWAMAIICSYGKSYESDNPQIAMQPL